MKRLLALVVPLVLTGGPALAVTPPPHHPASTTHTSHSTTAARASRDKQPTGKQLVGVVIDSVSPKYVRKPSEILKLHGQVQNQADSTFQRLTVRLRYSASAVQSRGALQMYADGKGFDPGTVGAPKVVSAVQPGGQQSWALSLPVSRMHLPKSGVYPISVEVLNAANTVVGKQRTFVTYFPANSPGKTNVSWVWPVIDQPHRADDSTFVDDKLERLLNTGGRLDDLVTAADPYKKVTWLLDPALADDAAQMTNKDGYTIKGTAQQPQSIAAGGWLNKLRGTLANKRVIATPYADPDVMALSRAGMAQHIRDSTDAVGFALGRAKLLSESTSVAVPPDGLADQQTLTNLVKAGARTILLNSTVLPHPAQNYTANPLARKQVAGANVKLVAYDDTINKVLATDTDEPGGVALAEQRFLAETAMVTNELPFNPRTLVVVPPRRWNPGPILAKDLLNLSAHAPWMRQVALSTVERQKKAEPRTFQPQKGQTGLPKRYLKQVKDLNGDVRRFTTIFQPQASGFTLGITRVESSAWADQTHSGSRLRQTLANELHSAEGKVKVLNDHWDLAGRSGQVPITISNELEHGTVRIKLNAYSQNDTRLHVEGPGQKQSEITLEAGHKEQVTLYMKAAANGPAYVNIQLLAPDGEPFAETRVLRVRATGYGRTALLITGISLAVLFVGVGYRVIRRRGDEAEDTTGG
ncbi:DUF6049 family protein [Actinoallomurus purpureus]|uniref:DUF6049 family protein n=1 Tax=Actinoallomurus purpureus TaxID=478114 RepID=UPI0020920AE2|nr:DUF6049 family protein [Actinoallomurus purpureus]MCO6007293.1 DUF6049 family protein [Actinoallomurus purpureus]